MRVAVLEARDRVGGRSLNHQFANGDLVDVGGQWIGAGHQRMLALAREFKFDIYPLYNRGKNLIRHNNKVREYLGTIPKLGLLETLQIGWLLWHFERLAAQIDPTAPYLHEQAARWDSITVQSWMDSSWISSTAKKVFAIGIKAVFTVEPKEVSLLHALFYASANQSLDYLISVEGGAQQDRLHGGTHQLGQALANSLDDAVFINQAVVRVEYSDQIVKLTCANGNFYSANKVILAIPPNQLLRISFNPPLPSSKDQMWQRMPAGSCIKCVAQYERPFWRDEGLSGQAIGLDTDLLVNVTFDNTQEGKTAGLLMGFIEGDLARYWSQQPASERKKAVLTCFAHYFGGQALTPIDYIDKDWSSEQWTRGCYAANFSVGGWTEFGRHLATPVGPIHFAGTETAREWYGYFEGALEAAERVVQEISHAEKRP